MTVDIDGLRVSLFVCYDLRFADEFWQLADDTDVYLVPANWPAKRRLAWTSLLQARAIENQAYVVGVNRVGEGGGIEYIGDSRIVDPLGELLATGLRRRVDPPRRRLAPTTSAVPASASPSSMTGASRSRSFSGGHRAVRPSGWAP